MSDANAQHSPNANSLFDLTGRVALVTGTSRGLGQYLARALAKSGADLILTARNREHVATFESEVKSLGRRAVSLDLDVRDHASIQKMAAAAEAAFGKIDILVNNAGCNVRKPALDVTWDDWNLILDTNLRGSFFVAQAIARGMVQRGYGRIINIGSVTSVAGYAGTRSLRSEPRRHPPADDELGRRLGQTRHYRKLPGAGLVSHRAKQSFVRK